MADVNVRVEAEVAEGLRQRAELAGMSLQAYANQVLRRQLLLDAERLSGETMLPVGLSSVAAVFDGMAATPKPDDRFNWVFVYRDSSRVALIAPGHLVRVLPMFLTIELFQSDHEIIMVPRAALIGWHHGGSAGKPLTEHDVFEFAWRLQRWGAFLHPQVGISAKARNVNGVLWPPGFGVPAFPESAKPRR